MWQINLVLLAGLCGAPEEIPQPRLTTFDYRAAELQWLDNRWQLRAGAELLKDFGRYEKDAREALRIIRELKLTQQGTVGYPRPVLEFWLSDGQAPADSITGLRTTAFDRDSLRIEQVDGQWCVRDARRILFSFGSHEDDARQAAAVIRKYGFDQVGYLGKPTPVMIYFLAGQSRFSSRSTFSGSAKLSSTMAVNDPFPRPVLRVGNQQRSGPGFSLPGNALPDDLPSLPGTRQLATPSGASPDAASLEDRIPLDWRRAQVRRDGPDWKVVDGNYTVANLGTNEIDARAAFAVLQHYRFSEHCLIGRPKVSFSYFLVNGQAPRGLCLGAHNTLFRPEMLSVQKQGEDFVIAEGSVPLFHFGSKDREAKEALQAIRRHHFDSVCKIGSSAEHSLTFFIRSR